MRIVMVLVAALSFAVAPPAIAKKRFMMLAASPDQQARMENGMRIVESALPHSNVRIFQSEDQVSKRGALMILVLNAGEKPVDVGSESVAFASGVLPVETIGYDRLVREEKKRQGWATFFTALGAVANSANAANAGYSSGTVNAYGSGGFATAHYSGYNGSANFAAQSIANAQNQASFDRLASTNAAALDGLRANMRTTTVDPGQSFGGLVTYELPKEMRDGKLATPITVTVRVGEESHTFVTSIEPEK